MKLVLPLPPNRANARVHWRKRWRQGKDYEDRLDNLQLIGQVPKPPPRPMARAVIRVRLFVWSFMDQDNAMGRCKWPVDWLVSRGYIVDDRPSCLSWDGVPAQEIDRKDQRVEIDLEAA